MPTAADTAPNGQASNDSSHETPGGSQPRLKVSRACNPCRRSKKKCNGELPCQQCVAQQIPDICIYGSNGRSNPRHKRVLHDAEQERDNLREIIHALRTMPDEPATGLFLRIRQGHSVDDLVSSIHAQLDAGMPAEGVDGLGEDALDGVQVHMPGGSFSDWLRLEETDRGFG